MKSFKNIISIVMLAFFAAISMNAQSGTIVMEITDVSSDNPQMAAMTDMFKGSETAIYFKDKVSVTKMNMMGGMVKVDVKTDAEQKTDMLMEMMGNKIWVETTKLEADRMKAEADNPMAEMEFTYDTEDTKEISGFNCYKMTIEFPDAEGSSIVGYVTEEIDVRPPVIQGVEVSEFRGFPLEFTFTNPMMSMTTMAKSFEDTVDESVFELNTSGFKKMTIAEFGEMMQSMGGGGFGF